MLSKYHLLKQIPAPLCVGSHEISSPFSSSVSWVELSDLVSAPSPIVQLQNAYHSIALTSHHVFLLSTVAHDFMDFDITNPSNPMGADGCIDMEHADNSGLPQDVWCDTGCPLTDVYNANFAHLSKADFWVAAGNAVIKIASNNALDMKDSYVSGRIDADSCVGQVRSFSRQHSSCFHLRSGNLIRNTHCFTSLSGPPFAIGSRL